MRRPWRAALVALALVALGLGTSGCVQYRQSARGITSAPSEGCADMSRGCGKTVWVWAWGAFGTAAPDSASCGNVGLAEVTVRSNPATFVVGLVTLGIATPRRVEWKCARPRPCPACGLQSPTPPGRT